MLNIISRSLISKHTRGPRKVVQNLIKGLRTAGYPFVINNELDATNLLWIHDDTIALERLNSLPARVKVIVGPNLYVAPQHVPPTLATLNTLWLQPSPWAKDFWDAYPNTTINTAVWPVGIDTIHYIPSPIPKKSLLVYVKQRDETDVSKVINTLTNLQLPFHVIRYGEYTEHDYHTLLSEARGAIWLGRAESQGIGLQEALAMNVPILVCDVSYFGDWCGPGKELFTPEQLAYPHATSAPFFSPECGMRIKSLASIEEDIKKFVTTLPSYTPRKFIENNLTTTKQAAALMELFKTHYQLTADDLVNSKIYNQNKWRNAKWWFRMKTSLKDCMRPLHHLLTKRN